MGTDFDNDQWYRTTIVGAGAAVTPSVTERGGVVAITTGAAGSGRISSIQPHGTVDLIANPQTDRWYMVWRAALGTGVDAAGNIDGSLFTATLGNPTTRFGAVGSVSITNYAYIVTNNAGATTASAATTVALDTSVYHVFEMWSDGTTTFFAMDGTTLTSIASTLLGTSPVCPNLIATNGATIAARTMNADYLYLCTANP
jgi:hypothetical protein